MKYSLYIIKEYLKKIKLSIILFIIIYFIMFILCFLYNTNMEIPIYTCTVSITVCMCFRLYDFYKFADKNYVLKKTYKNCLIDELENIKATDLLEQNYIDIIIKLNTILNKNITKKEIDYNDLINYYTMWVHQIKTPISAINLIMQSENEEFDSNELLEQIFSIEQYVDMVLQYLRFKNINNDLLIKKYQLDNIIKKCIKKYAKLFINKKLVLDYNELNCSVITDEKWLNFVIEQLLINALKYTSAGSIAIYMDSETKKTLVIEDTGIGISAEDIPRVFERGFTGYNGREDNKSSGLGLFLCKSIIDKLSHRISIDSEVGKGTKVKIEFDCVKLVLK